MKKIISSLTENMISQLAQDETGKRQYYRPVYSLHKWWARRPGALFRAILLAVQKNNRELFALAADGSISPRSDYFQDHDLEEMIVLDPFMGGGTTLAEANRLGAKVIGCDLNPVAYWVVRETLKPIDLEKLETYYRQLEKTAGQKIKDLYRTNCGKCGLEQDSLYSFWLRSVECPYCGHEVYLFKRCLLNEGRSRNKPPSLENPATVFCPACFHLNEWSGKGQCVCRACQTPFNPEAGSYDQGYFSCNHCGQAQIQLVEVMRAGKKLKEKLVALEYRCETCHERLYKAPDRQDREKLEALTRKFEENRESLIFPRQKILPGASSVRWRLHNFEHYYEIFNPRQLIAFNLLFEGIQAIPEEEYRRALITIFSNALEYNNMMTPYNYPHRKLHHLFNYHALPLTTTPVENSVWGVGTDGAGTFVNCYRRYVNAKQYCRVPFDKYKDSAKTVKTIHAKTEHIEAQFVSSFEELKTTPRGTLLFCGDSSSLPEIPDESVDFVITDPPYFDSIHYSELSNFFYVWLASLIDHPSFTQEHVPTEEEAIVNNGMDKGEAEYQNLLMSVFKESGRTLKKDGKLIFTFHHTKWRAWWTVLNAILGSGFRVIDSFPVLSEYKVNPHIRNKQSLDMDLVLVCQKQALPFEPLSQAPLDILARAARSLPPNNIHATNNKLFLHFMGELLRTASSLKGDGDLSYAWFENALLHFDDFLAKIKNHKLEMGSSPYSIKSYEQLRLLEEKEKYG
ncbi:MAG: DUF1156 domain-containing protein [Anaerolineales bacterium]|nr:DUF1156 domain-containing protein [Anaerolineales bacterium]